MELMEVLASRRSTRAFGERAVARADMERIVLAGCTAPVANAAYDTVRLVVITNADLLEKLRYNTAKAFHDMKADPFYGAGTVVVVCAQPREGAPGLEYANAGVVLENMLLAATELGIASVYLYGFLSAFGQDASLKNDLGVPEGFAPVSGAAFGYATDPPQRREPGMVLHCDWLE